MSNNKTWTVGDIIARLAHLPSSTQVYLEDADTSWTIHLFDIVEGHITSGDFIGAKAILISPSDYSDIDSNIDFKVVS